MIYRRVYVFCNNHQITRYDIGFDKRVSNLIYVVFLSTGYSNIGIVI